MSLIKVAWYVPRVKNMHFAAAAKAKPRYLYLILKLHGQSFRRQVRLLLSMAKPSYICSILKPHSQSSRSQVRPLLSEAKQSYNLEKTLPPQSWSHAVVCDSTPRMYWCSVYFLVSCIIVFQLFLSILMPSCCLSFKKRAA